MTTKLHAAARAFAAAYPTRPVSRTSKTWSGLCGILIIQFGGSLGGAPVSAMKAGTAGNAPYWKVGVSKAHSTAAQAMANSGWLNPTAAAAPVGAFHFWDYSTSGHVGIDLLGGGHTIFMASGRVRESWGSSLGVQSAAGYTGGRYRGWTTQYAGGVLNLPVETPTPPPAPSIAPNQRKTVAKGANVRKEPSTSSVKLTPIKGNSIVTCHGFVYGEEVLGSKVWFTHPFGVSHSSGFEDQGTHDLPNLTPEPPVVEPEPESPVVEPEPEPPVVEPEPEPPVVEPEPPVVEPEPTEPEKPKPGKLGCFPILGVIAVALAIGGPLLLNHQ